MFQFILTSVYRALNKEHLHHEHLIFANDNVMSHVIEFAAHHVFPLLSVVQLVPLYLKCCHLLCLTLFTRIFLTIITNALILLP